MINSPLLNRIKEYGYTAEQVAEKLGLSRHSLWRKYSGKIDWTVPEALKICKLLNIPLNKINVYFGKDSKNNEK